MAEIKSFPNNSDEYIGAEEVMHWLHGRTSGVYGANGNAAVSAVLNAMQVQVAPGIGWIVDAADNGICWWFDTAITLDIDPAEATGTLNRIDRVVVEWLTTDYADLPTVKILKGTNASTPTAPALTNNSTVRQLSLARISIPAGTTELSSLNIIDERMDETVCGIVTETVTADTSMIAAQYEEALQTLLDAIAQAWSGVISDGAVSREKLASDVTDELDELNASIIQSDVKAITANGTTTFALAGLTAYHVVGNWGMFSDSDLTTPIPENAPTCNLEITTSANSWTVTVANFSSTFYFRPTFIKD